MSSEVTEGSTGASTGVRSTLSSHRFRSMKMKQQAESSAFNQSSFAPRAPVGGQSETPNWQTRTISKPLGTSGETQSNATADGASPDSTSSLPEHLKRNIDPTSTEKMTYTRREEEDNENRKLIDAEKRMNWDDKRKLAEKAIKVREEFVATEKSYMESLNALNNVYLQKLNTMSLEDLGIQESHRKALTSNLVLIINLHQLLNADLEKEGSHIEDVIENYSNYFRVYTEYMNNYQRCLETFQALHETKKFQAFLSDVRTELKTTTKTSLDLMSYLIMPVQRVPRYVLLLKELKKNTLPSTEAFQVIDKSLTMVIFIAGRINESKRNCENITALLELQHRLSFDSNEFTLIQPHRRIIREDEVMITKTAQKSTLFGTVKCSPRVAFLFNDIFIWTNRDFGYKSYMNIAAAKIEDESETSFTIRDSTVGLSIQFADAATTTAWLTEIKQLKDDEKTRRANQIKIRKNKAISNNTNTSDVSGKIQNSFGHFQNQKGKDGDAELSVSKTTSVLNQSNAEMSTNSPSLSMSTTGQTPSVSGYRTRYATTRVSTVRFQAEQMKKLKEEHEAACKPE